jgi:mannosyltransferase OCH1-like enzyme
VIRYFALAYYGGTYLDLDLVPPSPSELTRIEVS